MMHGEGRSDRPVVPTKPPNEVEPESARPDLCGGPLAREIPTATRCRHRAVVFRGKVKARNNEVRKRKMTLKFHSWTPSLLQCSTSLLDSSLTAESGFKVSRSGFKVGNLEL
jgi:hypothetical protein